MSEISALEDKIDYKLPVIKSLLVPGWGEMTFRSYEKAKIFMFSDVVAMGGFLIFKSLNIKYDKSALLFASKNAGADGSYFNKSYLESLEIYTSSEDYNNYIKIKARDFFPNDIEKQKEYIEEHSYKGKKAWLWKSDSLRIEFKSIRREAKKYGIRSNVFFGTAILLRIISAFDTRFFTNPYPRIEIEDSNKIKIGIEYKIN